MTDWYWYEQIDEESVRILRMFGTSPEVIVPRQIAGKVVTELGAYCFAEKNQAASYQVCSEEQAGEQAEKEFQELLEKKQLRELAGRYIQKVTLPESVERIGNFCFYQCGRLEELVTGCSLTGIGSDAFMNCHKLQRIIMLGSVRKPSGLKQILAQRNLETEVTFMVSGQVEAVLLYPEYSEFYDEIGPAHIFKLNIEGEGFRARQCFQNAVVDLVQYDAGFLQASVREQELTLCRMALQRLYYPIELREDYRLQYEEYIREHQVYAGTFLIKERNLEWIQFAGEREYFSPECLEKLVCLAAEENWTEGAGTLLRLQKQNIKEEEYTFDDF